jgi:hypothetical protein
METSRKIIEIEHPIYVTYVRTVFSTSCEKIKTVVNGSKLPVSSAVVLELANRLIAVQRDTKASEA